MRPLSTLAASAARGLAVSLLVLILCFLAALAELYLFAIALFTYMDTANIHKPAFDETYLALSLFLAPQLALYIFIRLWQENQRRST